MKKLLILSLLALTASFAHAGSCGDRSGTDKKKDKKTALTASSMTLACDTSCDGSKKDKDGKAGMTEASMTFACDATCDGDKKGDKTGFAESAISMA